jgi:hypothetical protein
MPHLQCSSGCRGLFEQTPIDCRPKVCHSHPAKSYRKGTRKANLFTLTQKKTIQIKKKWEKRVWKSIQVEARWIWYESWCQVVSGDMKVVNRYVNDFSQSSNAKGDHDDNDPNGRSIQPFGHPSLLSYGRRSCLCNEKHRNWLRKAMTKAAMC